MMLTEATPSTNGYCDECGGRNDWRSGRCLNVECKVNRVDWSAPVLPSPVRLPTREEMLADSRCALWRTIDSLPHDRPVLITRQTATGVWLLERYAPQLMDPFIHGRAATHWCEDIVGQPVV
jgi:hypothetical protein